MNSPKKTTGLAAGRPTAKKQSLAALMSDEKQAGKTKRVSLDLDEAAFKKLKLHALEHDKSAADVLRELIEKHI